MKRAHVLIRLMVCLIVALPMGCRIGPSQPQNILLIVVDTVRADHLSLYGYGRPTTPTLQQLGQRGTVFENAMSTAPYTRPSTASILTGQYPAVHGAITHSDSISPGIPTLAETLQSAGYSTMGVHRNGNVSKTFGFGRGFDSYGSPDGTFVRRSRKASPAERVRFVSQTDDSLLTEMAMPLLTAPETPFFLYLHLGGAHDPYTPPPSAPSFLEGPLTDVAALFYEQPLKPFRDEPPVLRRIYRGMLPLSEQTREQMIALYDAEIAYADLQIAAILEVLEDSGQAENTIVVMTADHGEEFWDHGGVGHGESNFQEQLHVPLVVAGPGIEQRVVTEPISLIDLMPTLLDLVGVEGPPHLAGGSQAPVLRSSRRLPEPRPIFAEGLKSISSRGEPAFFRSLQVGNLKLILDFEMARKMLFELSEDPQETNNLINQDRSRSRTLMTQLIDLHEKNLNSSYLTEVETAEISSELDSELRALGYLGSPKDSVATTDLFRRPLRALGFEAHDFVGHEIHGADYLAQLDLSANEFPAEQLLFGWTRYRQGPRRGMMNQAAVRLVRSDQTRWQVRGRAAKLAESPKTIDLAVTVNGEDRKHFRVEPALQFELEGSLTPSTEKFVRLDLSCTDASEVDSQLPPALCAQISYVGLAP